MKTRSRNWLFDVTVGGIVGAVIGAVVAVNVVIYAGPDEGYESSLGDVFDHHLLIGVVTVVVLVAGPVVGALVARRLRTRRRH